MPTPPPAPSLFDQPRDTPLAERLRPTTLDELVGQEKVVGPGMPLRAAIERDRLHSLILWGPPGCGKTTLARMLAKASQAEFAQLSAVTSGIADVRAVVEGARARRERLGSARSPRPAAFHQ